MKRKLCSILGYPELSVNDISRQTKRKYVDLKDEIEPSLKKAKLLPKEVIAEEEDNPMPKPDASKNVEGSQSLQYLDYSLLTDPDTICLLSSSLIMVVMWGLPGSGKSAVVSAITRLYPHAVVCSVDHFLMKNGKHKYSLWSALQIIS